MELTNMLMSRPDMHLEREFMGNWARSASELVLYAESSYMSSAHASTRCLWSEDNMCQGQNKGRACPDPVFYLAKMHHRRNTPANTWFNSSSA